MVSAGSQLPSILPLTATSSRCVGRRQEKTEVGWPLSAPSSASSRCFGALPHWVLLPAARCCRTVMEPAIFSASTASRGYESHRLITCCLKVWQHEAPASTSVLRLPHGEVPAHHTEPGGHREGFLGHDTCGPVHGRAEPLVLAH